MLTLGIFANTFPRGSPAENAEAVGRHGVRCVHYNLSCAGVEPMPRRIDPALVAKIREALTGRGITMASLGGSFNMIHPDHRLRLDGLARLRELASHARALGTGVVTVCTGTRDPHDMWSWHPDNDDVDAWRDLCHTMAAALEIAEEAGVTLGVEPEPDNVVSSARLARRLIDEMRSQRLGILFDPANFLRVDDRSRMRTAIDEAFDLLADRTVLAHAKDVRFEGSRIVHCAAGAGELDHAHCLSLLQTLPDMPLITHHAREEEVPTVLSFLTAQLERSRLRA